MSKLNWEKANRAETWAGRQKQKRESLLQKLQAASEQGAKRERERIIKLLEEECSGEFPKVIEMSLSSLIHLIKGEQK